MTPVARCRGYDVCSIACGESPMSKTDRPYDPDQQLLLPSALGDSRRA